jgi:hydrogenase expression/formation protein HypC
VPRDSRPHRKDRRRREAARHRRCGRQVNIACIVDDARPVEGCVGDWVLVHVGFAMSRIDEKEAAETLKILTELGEAQAEIEAMRLSAAEVGRAAS